MKSKGIAYLLWFFLGVFGVHYFYLGKIGRGLLWLFTLGFFTIGWFVDLFTLSGTVDNVNTKYELAHLRTATGALLAKESK